MKIQKREKFLFTVELSVFILLLYGTTVSIHLNGDDFMYGTFAQKGVFENVWAYYFTGNGRFWVNILDSILLYFDRYAFIVVAPWIVLSFVWLFAKILQVVLELEDQPEKLQEFMQYGMVLFSCLDVLCLRETVFWITGMMNYFFPAVILLLGYYLFRLSCLGKLHGVRLIGYYVVCFFASSSVEQYALMFVGLMTLHHGWDILHKKKIPVYEWIAYGVAMIGLAVLILAPGNFVRVSEQQPVWFDNLWTLITHNTVKDVALPYMIMLCICSIFLKKREESQTLYLWSIPVLAILMLGVFKVERAIPWILVILLMFLLIIPIFWNNPRKQRIDMIFWSVVGIGSQIMLMVSIVWGFRCMLSVYLVYMILIALSLQGMQTKEKLFVLCSGILTAINPSLTLCFWGISAIFCYNERQLPSVNLQKELLRLCSVASLIILCIGYGSNLSTYQENLLSTSLANEYVIVKELPNEIYSWYQVPFNKVHDRYYREYNDLGNIDIKYVVKE